MKTLLIISLISSILILHSSANLIEPVCKSTDDYNLCKDILQSDHRSPTADTKGLALVMMDALKNKTGEAMNTLNKLEGNARPEMAKALQQCEAVYARMVKSDIPKAQHALILGNPKYAESIIASAEVRSNYSCHFEGGFGDSAQGAVTNFVSRIFRVVGSVINRLI